MIMEVKIEERLIMLPGDQGFTEILQTPPPNWRSHDYFGETGLVRNQFGGMRPVNQNEFWDYVLGGEAEELGVL